MYERCAFSGHRKLNLYDFNNLLLDRIILNLIKNGTKEFYCGMAVGFDVAAAESVLFFKKKYDVKLIACLPCDDQAYRFSAASRQRYERVLTQCDEVISLAPLYFSGCMHARDRYLVDNCDVLVCFLRKNSGGTFYTVNYARQSNKKLIEL